ncbi:hypothetical protein J0383_07870 [Flavobacterium endoglycinae]|uniref:DUF669 domain-containing protein n=1 Tax=Flavobacterium endoglycinae TaxID=2816357 RepID=A0ABX7QK11_9FLAO|nr:hypothetical protein [Flavobacterium endoglycinae]QSW90716.1 hypothetical protein J0383_07870 [Flavobacterium endoglycinae]
MKVPFINLYSVIDAEKQRFEDQGLDGNFYMDKYRGQPADPEQFEYFTLPAIFVDYTITGQGKDKPRLIQITLHLLVDEENDMSNVAPNYIAGMNSFVYCGVLQEILEGRKLVGNSVLKFVSEVPIDNPVADYHSMIFEFESYAKDLIANPVFQTGEFDKPNVTGMIKEQEKKEAV